LYGAACVGRHNSFELPPPNSPDYDSAAAAAVSICKRCPVFTKCEQYLAAMPVDLRPVGMVLAARVVPKPGRRHNAA
jgi:hypothetical protein